MAADRQADRGEALLRLAQALLHELKQGAPGRAGLDDGNGPQRGAVTGAKVEPAPKRLKGTKVTVLTSSETARRFRMIAATRTVTMSSLFEEMVRDLPDRV